MSAIDDKYLALGGPGGFLGNPADAGAGSEEMDTADRRGRFRDFERGSIYWKSQTGAHEVHGDIRIKWAQLGGERGFLGFPVTDELGTPDGRGRFNHFEGGSIYWKPETHAHEVHGAIRDKWASMGWERSRLGYPISDEKKTSDGRGRFSDFEGGRIHWTPERGAEEPETQTSQWSQFPGSPAGTARHDDIYFVDENTGWSVRATGLIHKTTDGGNTWALKLTKTGTHFRCIGFTSPSRGFAGNLGVGSYDAVVTDSNVLYQTFDGGDTWKNVPGFAEEGMKGLCAMYILDANHVYGGGRVRGPAYFIKSTDGGANWTIRNLTAMGVMNGIMDIYFQDPLNGFVVGMDPNKFSADCSPPYHGRLAKTTDGGETWTPVLTTDISCGYLWKMSWPTPQIGYVSMQQNGSYSEIAYYKTTDGGNNWVLKEIPLSSLGLGSSSFYLQGIGFVSPDEGWVGGTAGIAYPSSFLHTSDGGDTWSKSGYNNTYRINRIRFLNSGFGVAAGERLHVFRP